MIVPIPIGNLYPHYVKKEDARDIPKSQRKFMGIFIIGLGIVLAVMQFFVVSRLKEMFIDLEVAVPPLTQASSYISVALIVLSLIGGGYLLSTEPDYDKLDKVISKYKAGEMIKTKELLDNKKAYWFIAATIALVGYVILIAILPVYNLTSQFQ